MKLRQRHFGDSVEIDPRDEDFEYTIRSSGTKKQFSVDYIHFDPSVVETTEQANTWWRNVGIAWLAIGAFLTVMKYAAGDGLRVSWWLYLGLLFLAVYRLGRTSFTHHAIEGGGRVVLIKDQKAGSILEELKSRRIARLLQEYGEVDFEQDPEREIAKFKWLETEGALSTEDVARRISAIRSAGASDPEEIIPDVN